MTVWRREQPPARVLQKKMEKILATGENQVTVLNYLRLKVNLYTKTVLIPYY